MASSCWQTDISTLTLKEISTQISFCSGSVIYCNVCSCLCCDLLADEFVCVCGRALKRAVCEEGKARFYQFCRLHADYKAEDDAVETQTHDCPMAGGLNSPDSSEVVRRGLSLICKHQ